MRHQKRCWLLKFAAIILIISIGGGCAESRTDRLLNSGGNESVFLDVNEPAPRKCFCIPPEEYLYLLRCENYVLQNNVTP